MITFGIYNLYKYEKEIYLYPPPHPKKKKNRKYEKEFICPVDHFFFFSDVGTSCAYDESESCVQFNWILDWDV